MPAPDVSGADVSGAEVPGADSPGADMAGAEVRGTALPEGARHRGVLDRLVDQAGAFADLLLEEARALVEAEPPGVARATALARLGSGFDGLARTARRTAAFSGTPGQPPKTAASPRIAARRRIIRGVEDAIQCDTEGSEAAALRAELAERLDDPDLDDEIDQRPVGEIIAEIWRDLGLAAMPGTRPWKRRTPRDVAALNALAARPAAVRPVPAASPGVPVAPPQPASPAPRPAAVPVPAADMSGPGPVPERSPALPDPSPALRDPALPAGRTIPSTPARPAGTAPRPWRPGGVDLPTGSAADWGYAEYRPRDG